MCRSPIFLYSIDKKLKKGYGIENFRTGGKFIMKARKITRKVNTQRVIED